MFNLYYMTKIQLNINVMGFFFVIFESSLCAPPSTKLLYTRNVLVSNFHTTIIKGKNYQDKWCYSIL